MLIKYCKKPISVLVQGLKHRFEWSGLIVQTGVLVKTSVHWCKLHVTLNENFK